MSRFLLSAGAGASSSIAIPSGNAGVPLGTPEQCTRAASLAQSAGGTIYGSTPGGTRFVYRYSPDAMKALAQSPLSKGARAGMITIPGVTVGGNGSASNGTGGSSRGSERMEELAGRPGHTRSDSYDSSCGAGDWNVGVAQSLEL